MIRAFRARAAIAAIALAIVMQSIVIAPPAFGARAPRPAGMPAGLSSLDWIQHFDAGAADFEGTWGSGPGFDGAAGYLIPSGYQHKSFVPVSEGSVYRMSVYARGPSCDVRMAWWHDWFVDMGDGTPDNLNLPNWTLLQFEDAVVFGQGITNMKFYMEEGCDFDEARVQEIGTHVVDPWNNHFRYKSDRFNYYPAVGWTNEVGVDGDPGVVRVGGSGHSAHYPVVQGHTYQLKIKTKGPGAGQTGIGWWSSGGFSSWGCLSGNYTNTPDWTTRGCTTGPAPSGIVEMTVYFQGDGEFDDLQLIDTTPNPAPQQYGTGAGAYANNTSRFEAEPVNTAIGNYVSAATDFALPGRGIGLTVGRTYNSLNSVAGPLGPGWSFSYAAHMQSNPDGSVTFIAEDGQQLTFPSDGQGGYVRPTGSYTGLTATPGGGWDLLRRDQVKYSFDAGGALTAQTDRNGNALTFSYVAGRLATITDTVGRAVTLSYDGAGRLSGIAGPPNRTIGYAYDPNGRLMEVTDLRGKVTHYTYDPSGRLITIVDANNHTVVTNEYGPDGRISAQTDARGKRSTFAWDAPTQTSTYTDANGGVWVDVYQGNVLQSSRDPMGDLTNFGYDGNFNRTSVTDPRGKITLYTYDPNSNLLTRTAPAPLNHQELWTYNARNDVATYRDGRLHITTYDYDPSGNLIKATAPLAAITQYGRDPAGTGLLFSVTDPRTKTTSYGYDAQANRNRITSPLGNVTTMTYDPAGRLLTVVDPRGNVAGGDPNQYMTTLSYDAVDHPLTSTDPLSHTETRTYDDVGNLLTIKDPNQHTTTYGYDEANHLTSVTDARNGITTYGYDNVGNIVTRLDAKNHTTSYHYDLANRLSTTTDPLSHAWTLTYDAASNVATRVDANNKTTTYVYDELNRLTGITYADTSTPSVTFGYDANSNLTSMTDGAGSETYAFDDLNRNTSAARGTDSFGYGYDPAGNITSRTYPAQSAQTFVYDDDGRLTSANGATNTYDVASNLTAVATPDGFTARYTYDRAGRLLEEANTRSSGTLSRFTFGLDPAGNRTAMTTRQATVTYRYDELNRVTEACWSSTTCPSGSPATPLTCLACIGGLLTRPTATVNPPVGETYRDYTYDGVGNRVSEVSNAGTTSYAYDNSDRLTSITAPGNQVTAYTFDNNGNQTSAGARIFTYDLADRLKTAMVSGVTETYTYAGDGTRLSASTGAQANKTTKYLWDRNFNLPQLAIERNGSGSLLRSYLYAADRISQKAGSSTYYYHADGLGSVADITSSTGSSLSWMEDYPFGSPRQAGAGNQAPSVQPFGFTGEQLDSTTGFYYLRAREYDPGIGRFLSTDPMSPPITNPYLASYLYAHDNPVRLTDPSGRCPWCILGAIGAVAGVVTYGVGVVASNVVQGHNLTEGLNVQDAVISAASGFAIGATGGLGLIGRVTIGFGTGAVSTLASQAWNGRPVDPGEVFLGAGFGAAGGAIDFGSGLVGFFRGIVGGGGLNGLQNWLDSNRMSANQRLAGAGK